MKAPALANPRGRSRASQALLFGTMVLVPLTVALVVIARLWTPSPLPPPPAVAASLPIAPEPSTADDPTPEIRGHILDADGNAVNGATTRCTTGEPTAAGCGRVGPSAMARSRAGRAGWQQASSSRSGSLTHSITWAISVP